MSGASGAIGTQVAWSAKLKTVRMSPVILFPAEPNFFAMVRTDRVAGSSPQFSSAGLRQKGCRRSCHEDLDTQSGFAKVTRGRA